MTKKIRCPWAGNDALYVAYHDEEWGRVVRDGRRLFEKICLEGQQAGLAWITVLRKREAYRAAFHDFDPHKVAAMDEAAIERLMNNPGLIRHRAKLEAIVRNARAYLAMQAQGEDFARFVWQFAPARDGRPAPRSMADIPARTAESLALSRALKKRGFVFVGAVTCYAFMQSMGLVNDHLQDCMCRAACEHE